MRAATLVAPALVGALLAPPVPVRAEERPAPAPSPRPGRLKLGPYADPYAKPDAAALLQALRFQQHIEVEGKAPRDPNVAMATWWQHFDFETSIYGRGYNIQTPVHPGAINILPLVDWVAKKIKDARRNKDAAEE